MDYISIDIETTGLDWNKHQILEIGAIATELGDKRPYELLPKFHCYVRYETIIGDPYALNMNANIIKNMVESPYICLSSDRVMSAFSLWLDEIGYEDNIQIAGKNYDNFDKRFLELLPNYSEVVRWGYRSALDPAILYLIHLDDKLPSLQTCLQRAGLEGEVNHNALSDAWDVIRCLRAKGY